MISMEEAVAGVLTAVAPLGTHVLALDRCRGAVLAGDVLAAHDTPPFDASAMDGYAVRHADLTAAPVTLAVIGTSSCGRPSDARVTDSTAVRILTGAVLPEGADCVVPVEMTDAGREQVEVLRAVREGASIRRRGEITRQGDRVLAAGTTLTAAHLGVAAGEGRRELQVVRRPSVAVVATGDELVAPGGELGPGQIFDSNSTLMAELAAGAGCRVVRHHAGDDAARLGALLEKLAADVDVILTSGGVSMGAEFDPLRDALAAHPVEFLQIAIKPAKPLAVGTVGAAHYVGLPGNPVSVVVSFELFVRPLLQRLGGVPTGGTRLVTGVLDSPLERGEDGRTHFVPVRRTATGTWERTELLGSHALSSIAVAEALAVLTPEELTVPAGGTVALLPLWTQAT